MADETPLKEVAEHLEFLGYHCEWQPDGWLYASHPVRWNLSLRPMEMGVRFYCSIVLGLLTDAKRAAWLEFLNRMNDNTLVARFTIVENTPASFMIRGRTLAPGEYRRRDFGAWMDMWHHDLERLHDGPSLEEDEEEEESENVPEARVN